MFYLLFNVTYGHHAVYVCVLTDYNFGSFVFIFCNNVFHFTTNHKSVHQLATVKLYEFFCNKCHPAKDLYTCSVCCNHILTAETNKVRLITINCALISNSGFSGILACLSQPVCLPSLSNIPVECISDRYLCYPCLTSIINEPFPCWVKSTKHCALGACAETSA